MGPISCNRTLKKEKERKKESEKEERKRREKKGMVALLVFIMATLKIVFARKKTF